MSPFANTGMRTACLISAIVAYSASPSKRRPGAAVHGQRLDAGEFRDARDAYAVAGGRLPAGADLERDRNLHGAHGRLEDGRDQRLVAQQRRACLLVADLPGRAAHVDVDDLRAGSVLRRAASAIICASPESARRAGRLIVRGAICRSKSRSADAFRGRQPGALRRHI
jgi:hypothetical protein